MKLFGITIIFAAASAMGIVIGEKYISMLKGIKRTEIFIKNLILGLENGRMTLPEMFENVAAYSDKKTKIFIEQLKYIQLCISSKTALECGFCTDTEANSILSEALFVLGKYSAEEQIKELSFCRDKLRAHYDRREEHLKTMAKLSRCSGFFAGIFLAIILF